MLISYNWLKSLLGADPGAARVADRLTTAGVAVDRVEHVGVHLRDIRVARVLGTRPHPTSRQPLSLVTIDPGSGEALEVVCGAPNVPPAGGLVAFAPVGATVLGKGGDAFTLEARPVAGVVSRGMLCAEDELGIGTEHAGILVLEDAVPGTPLASLVGLEDQILTLDLTPNRGDALSHVGVAREVAALLGLAFVPPPADAPARIAPGRIQDHVAVRVEDPEGCPRYAAALVQEVTIGPSPLWLRARLHRLGVRPINNVVDVTNLVMLEFGQPLHAFDLTRVEGRAIVVRRAAQGETMVTLDGQTRVLAGDLLIADARGGVAVAGVMGGDRSGVAATTREVLLECASFDPRGVRRTARRLGLHTESSHRFERGTDIDAIPDVLATAAAHLTRLAGGAAVGGTVDVYSRPAPPRVVTLRPARARALLGMEVPRDDAARILDALGCDVDGTDPDALRVTIARHRHDLALEVDLIEEIARVWGYARIPSDLPRAPGARAGVVRDFHLRRQARDTLCALGLDEAINFVFASPRELAALGIDPAAALRLSNPLSDERSHLRPSLLPRMVGLLGRARRHGESRVRLFEIGSVFGPALAGGSLPDERTRVAVLLAGARDAWLTRAGEVDFFDLKGVVEELAARLTGEEPVFHRDAPPPPWAHPRAWAHVRVGAREAGTLAVLHPDVVERADLGSAAVVAELDAAALGQRLREPRAKAPPRFPAVRRDVALQVPRATHAGEVERTLRRLAGPLCESVVLFDRYEGPELAPGTRSLAFALTFRADDRSLQDAEIDALAEAAVRGAREAHGAAQR